MTLPLIETIDAQNAGYFSELAYLPIDSGFNDIKDGLSSANFPGWSEITQIPGITDTLQQLLANIPGNTLSGGVYSNQFRIFTNGAEVVFAFKGSSSAANWIDDLKNSGGQAYLALEDTFAQVYAALKNNPFYAGANFIMDGHSLGGGLAQSFALATGSQGFGQNALPISTIAQHAIPDEFSEQSVSTLISNYPTDGFIETNTDGDIASIYYSRLGIGGGIYIDDSPTTLSRTKMGMLG